MKYDINYIRVLLKKKVQGELGEEDKEKVENLRAILENNNVFFMLDVDTAIGILYYLGVPEESIKDAYMDLTAPEAFKETNDVYVTMGEK